MFKSLFLVISLVAGLLVSNLFAQVTFPRSVTVGWDPNAASEGITDYTFTINGVATTVPVSVCSASLCAQVVTIQNSNPNNVTVVANNQWGTSAPATLTFAVVNPGQPKNLKATK
tara:strand:- start:983 stop:1327 length:345 start_codon:yes stop_codon:yes gene_type:complete